MVWTGSWYSTIDGPNLGEQAKYVEEQGRFNVSIVARGGPSLLLLLAARGRADGGGVVQARQHGVFHFVQLGHLWGFEVERNVKRQDV